MFSKRLALTVAGLLILVFLAACAPVPPATQAPAATQAAPAQQPVAAPTNTIVPSPAPAPTPTPAIPDPKTDPGGALVYASGANLFKTAEFTYTMGMTMEPADEASRQALGAQADQLKNFLMEAKGSGALEVTGPEAMKSRVRMDMNINAAGQDMQIQMIVIDETAWVKLAGQDTWQKVEGEQATSVAPGMDPEQMLEDFKNAADVEWVEDVTQDGEQLSHLRFTMDPSKTDLSGLTSSITSSADLSAEELQAMFQNMQPVVDVWLAKPTLELRGEKMQLEWVMPLPEIANAGDAKLRMAMMIDMQFTNVNEPVSIEPPAE